MKSDKELWEEFGKAATILGFIADVIAMTSLLVSSLPESRTVNTRVWIVFQYTILFLGVISYSGYLRQIWRADFKPSGISFAKYLVGLLTLDDWKKLIPPLIMFSFLVLISLQVNIVINILIWSCVIFSIVYLIVTFLKERKLERNEYDDQRARDTLHEWIPRIDKVLTHKGYLTNIEMARNYNEGENYCAKVLYYYYKVFIDEKDLIFSEEKWYNPNGGSYDFFVVALRFFAESKPWLAPYQNNT